MPVVEGHLFAPGDLSCLRASSFKISLVSDGANPTSTIIEGAAGDQYEVFSSSAGKVSVKCLRLFGDHDTHQAKASSACSCPRNWPRVMTEPSSASSALPNRQSLLPTATS
jgi:hypothetical protein